LNDSFALINLLAKQNTQIASFGPKDVLPHWLIAEKSQRIGDELPGAFQLTTDCGNEDERAWRQGRKDVSDCARLSSWIGQSPALRRSSLLYLHPRSSILDPRCSTLAPKLTWHLKMM
jgi:hypothetical protein